MTVANDKHVLLFESQTVLSVHFGVQRAVCLFSLSSMYTLFLYSICFSTVVVGVSSLRVCVCSCLSRFLKLHAYLFTVWMFQFVSTLLLRTLCIVIEVEIPK